MDKIELPLDLARALYQVFATWGQADLPVHITSGYLEMTRQDYLAMEEAMSKVDEAMTMEALVALRGEDDAR